MAEQVKAPAQKKTEQISSGRARSEFGAGSPGLAGELMALQDAAGNAAVSEQVASGSAASGRSRLRVSQPGDRDEREAERVAEAVMRSAGGEPVANAGEGQRIQRNEDTGGTTTVGAQTVQQVELLKEDGKRLSPSVRSFFEPRFGRDFGDVRVHAGPMADEATRSFNAEAFTYGKDIVFATGKYDPSTSRGSVLLAHELTHVVQHDKSSSPTTEISRAVPTPSGTAATRKAAQEEAKREEQDQRQSTTEPIHPTVRIWELSYLRTGPSPGDLVHAAGHRLHFRDGQTVELLATQGEWIKVRGKAFTDEKTSPGTRTGWIKREWTSIAPVQTAGNENERIAQDLDDFLDSSLLPTLDKWIEGVRIQGKAYLTAYNHYKDTLEKANQQAQQRAEIYAAVLTTVSAGALGWLGEAAEQSKNVTELLGSEARRGAIEDAIQAGLGETIDVTQGGWFSRHVVNQTHPLHYLNDQLKALNALRGELRKRVGETKKRIRSSEEQGDRAAVRLEIYEWWSQAKVREAPRGLGGMTQKAMAEEMERGFWQRYILKELHYTTSSVRSPKYGSTIESQTHYVHPEAAVRTRLDELGIKNKAGISEWSGLLTRMVSSSDVIKLKKWARSYEPKVFGGKKKR